MPNQLWHNLLVGIFLYFLDYLFWQWFPIQKSHAELISLQFWDLKRFLLCSKAATTALLSSFVPNVIPLNGGSILIQRITTRWCSVISFVSIIRGRNCTAFARSSFLFVAHSSLILSIVPTRKANHFQSSEHLGLFAEAVSATLLAWTSHKIASCRFCTRGLAKTN